MKGFIPGFRMSVVDGLILATGAVGAWWLGSMIWWGGLIVGVVVGHFFLFCNVFRISRLPELVWALAFTGLTAGTVMVNVPNWTETIGISLLLAVILIVREMKNPAYHGVGWRTINPGLPAWWKTKRDQAGKI